MIGSPPLLHNQLRLTRGLLFLLLSLLLARSTVSCKSLGEQVQNAGVLYLLVKIKVIRMDDTTRGVARLLFLWLLLFEELVSYIETGIADPGVALRLCCCCSCTGTPRRVCSSASCSGGWGWLVIGMLGVHFDGYSDSMPSRPGGGVVVIFVVDCNFSA